MLNSPFSQLPLPQTYPFGIGGGGQKEEVGDDLTVKFLGFQAKVDAPDSE